jgi:murein DD-endopeptidase MepM/ murein hydrolase activator NlpD
MERTMSVEDKIKRAEEIYAKRQEGTQRKTATVSLNNDDNKKDIKLLKKMVIQIILSLLIYGIIYIIQNNNYIFSEEFLKKADEILSYDMNFSQMYQDIKSNIEKETLNIKNNLQKNDNQQGITNLENNAQNETEQGAIGGANEQETNTTDANSNQNNPEENNSQENTQELSQEEKDINNIKATTTFIKPIEGTISSKYGQREPTTATVPKNHTGVDIAANMGTKIKSATSGEVVIASEEGDYGKHLKIQIGDVSIIYAHCNNLYVKQGDQISQGQEIAEVGTTGNSTGPHLHFEIRISERTIDPQKILEI